MPDDFDLEAFIQSLIETVVWCWRLIDPVSDFEDIIWLLTGHDSELWRVRGDALQVFCQHIAAARSQCVSALDISDYAIVLPVIQKGRFMVFYPDLTLSDEVPEVFAPYFLDFDGYPRWDAWVYFHTVPPHSHAGQLIAWVPPEFIDDVNGAIESSADESIVWLTNLTETELAAPIQEALKAANLWI